MKLERSLLNDLIQWKHSFRRKPLLLKGMRQCGKTWLLKEFASREFEHLAYFNFEEMPELIGLFDGSLEPKRLLMLLGTYSQGHILPEKTLIFFDEIQLCPRALTTLKYFCEEAPDYAVVAAGSLLGVTLASLPKSGFPVGKVDQMELHPCSFGEFLNAAAPSLADYCGNLRIEALPDSLTIRLAEYLRQYLITGGMPAVVSAFFETGNWETVDRELKSILDAYLYDFTKHVSSVQTREKLYLLWNSIPAQLARGNERFFFNEVKSGARAKDLEDSMQWLEHAGFVQRVCAVTSPQVPLTAYADRKMFKLYLSDIGLLRYMTHLTPLTILEQNDLFEEFKGRFMENYVLQQMIASGFGDLHYWTSGNQAEIDFLFENDAEIIPLEVKSGINLKAKSLKLYRKMHEPILSVRSSLQNLKLEEDLLNVPLYLLMELKRLIKLAGK